jgi:hypothetical protein
VRSTTASRVTRSYLSAPVTMAATPRTPHVTSCHTYNDSFTYTEPTFPIFKALGSAGAAYPNDGGYIAYLTADNTSEILATLEFLRVNISVAMVTVMLMAC